MAKSAEIGEIVVVLGHTNSAEGALSKDAISRIATAVEHIRCIKSDHRVAIVTTGGFGDHFNMSNIPHGALLARELRKDDLGNCELLRHIHSCGTADDALGVLRLFREISVEPEKMTVVTSGYHKRRAEYIFSRLFPWVTLNFVTDDNNGTLEQQQHERMAIERDMVALPNLGGLAPNHEAAAERLLEELKHYDNLSYLALVPAFATAYIWVDAPLDNWPLAFKVAALLLSITITGMFFAVYLRLVGTAASARRTLTAVFYVLGQPHLGTSKNLAAKLTPKIPISLGVALVVAWLLAITATFYSGSLDFGSNQQIETEKDDSSN